MSEEVLTTAVLIWSKLNDRPSILDGADTQFTLSRRASTGVNRRVSADLPANPGGDYPAPTPPHGLFWVHSWLS
jgi:hypothetical protein